MPDAEVTEDVGLLHRLAIGALSDPPATLATNGAEPEHRNVVTTSQPHPTVALHVHLKRRHRSASVRACALSAIRRPISIPLSTSHARSKLMGLIPPWLYAIENKP